MNKSKLNEELKKLEEKKQNLIDRGIRVRDKVREFETFVKHNKKLLDVDTSINPVILHQSLSQSSISKEELNSIKKLVSTTENVVGYSFEDVNKKWLRDDVWLYESTVILKVMQFKLNLTVDKKNRDDDEILDIMCHFSNVEDYIIQEITPWVKSLTSSKNFSHLMFVFSEYNDQSILRNKILNKLKNQNIITTEQCTDKGGGLIAYVHSPQAIDKRYLKYCWRLQLNSKTLSIGHIFHIDDLDTEFTDSNEELLEKFCKSELRMNEIENLWCNLSMVVKNYQN